MWVTVLLTQVASAREGMPNRSVISIFEDLLHFKCLWNI